MNDSHWPIESPTLLDKRDSSVRHPLLETRLEGLGSWLDLHRLGSLLIKVKDTRPKTLELGSLQGLGHVVPLHLICWAVLYLDVSLLDLICHKEVPDVDVP